MLRLPKFEVAEPTSVAEATALLREHEGRARPMAGGTDLMPNMKHEITTPDVVVGLWRIPDLVGVTRDGDTLRIGALTTLHDLAKDPLVLEHTPALAEAADQIAGPQLRRMGTIGGNVCLDTRCVYINQTYFWRSALGFCLKRDGTVCHVVKGGRRCVAAASNDSAPVLMTLGAELEIHNAEGARRVAIDDFYTTDGIFNQARADDDLVTAIHVPIPKAGTVMAYAKLRTRAAIDFPELGVAVLARLVDDTIDHVDVCVTALASRPVRVKLDLDALRGHTLDKATIDRIAEVAYKRCKPLSNIATEPAYRREMVPVFVRRAFRQALGRA